MLTIKKLYRNQSTSSQRLRRLLACGNLACTAAIAIIVSSSERYAIVIPAVFILAYIILAEIDKKKNIERTKEILASSLVNLAAFLALMLLFK